MRSTRDQIEAWCRTLLDTEPSPERRSLAKLLQTIPTLDQLSDIPRGTVVLVRGDVDAKPGAAVGDGDIRLRSMIETLRFGIDRGWRQVIFGHIGRKPEESLAKVAARLGQLLSCEVPLIEDWFDESALHISSAAQSRIHALAPGSVCLLQNVRRYRFERLLWDATAAEIPQLADTLAPVANAFAQQLGTVYVHEALSAGSLDTSSTIVPAAMDRVALGLYAAQQLSGPLMECMDAGLVIFSGLKIDKLDDLQAIVRRGKVRMVISAGSLAMALKKADAERAGKPFCLGVAEDPAHRDKPYFIPPERVAQARRLLDVGQQSGVQFVLPVDFVLQDGQVATQIGPGDQQFDIGPQSSELFSRQVTAFIESLGARKVAFHNGVFGMFEDPRFEKGTQAFMKELQRMKRAGVAVYVGGGEGGTALEKYGEEDWITHCFTAGGTVLSALGEQPIPYLVALALAAAGSRS